MVDIADRTTGIGVAQGVGWSLHESYVYNEGGPDDQLQPARLSHTDSLTPAPHQYRVIEVPASDGPYGVRGVGEVPIVPPAGTLANAIYDAIGIRMNRLPMSPKNVFMANHAIERTDWLSMDDAQIGGATTVAGVDIPNDE